MTKRHFRASIYVDIWVEDTEEGLEAMREKAKTEAEEIAKGIPNSFVGGVACFTGDPLHPLDGDI